MSDNAKNMLQEFCQQNRLPLPEYTRKRDDDDGLWYSTVTFCDQQYAGEGRGKKSAADIAAAERALSARSDTLPHDHTKRIVISNDQVEPIDIVVVPRLQTLLPWAKPEATMFVVVDYENINKLTQLHNKFVDSNGIPVEICKIVGHCNQKSTTDEPSHVVKGQGSDAVDHFISMCVGQIIASPADHHRYIAIVTRDMFGAHLENFAKDIPEITITHFASEKKAVDYLVKHGCLQTNVRYSYKDD